jgi:hypothetical protein
MGILDDAIREHLDLKRRRGADPTEVERAEREALGPVRRNREAAGAPGLEADPETEVGFAHDLALEDEAGFAYDQEGDEDWTYDSADDPRLAADDAPPLALADHDLGVPAPPGAFAPPPVHESPEPAPAIGQIPPDDGLGEVLGAPEPFAADPPPAEHGGGGGGTAEYDVEQALGADDEKDEDVLEETPEFLQDTPDHDRLWFEQRPPKDFDFDG